MLRGIDISQWQSVGTGDGDYDFVFCKATEGVGYTDPNCDGHYQRAKSQGKLLGVYHFARPGCNDPISEADWFVSQIQGYIGEAILALDWEVEAVWNIDWAKRWLDRVYETTGVKPVVYASGSVISGYDWSSVVNADYGLWIAYWPNNYQYSNDWPSSPDDMSYGTGAWPFWAIWQFSSRNGTLDCDVANMDRDGWMRYAAKNGNSAPASAPAPAPQKSIDDLANEVIRGDWGNGQERVDRLTAAGYDYNAVQNRVNEILGVGSEEYVVSPGDTLWGIAEKFGTTWQKIYTDNKDVIGDDPSIIYPGQVLKIH